MSQITEEPGNRRTTSARLATGAAALALSGASLVAGPLTASAAAHGNAPACAQAKHRFVAAVSAKVDTGGITVKAHKATFHCGGPDDGSYNVAKAKETLTVTSTAKVKVFKKDEDPSKYIRVKASALPHWLKKNKAEDIYRIAGPASGITKLVEQFHP